MKMHCSLEMKPLKCSKELRSSRFQANYKENNKKKCKGGFGGKRDRIDKLYDHKNEWD